MTHFRRIHLEDWQQFEEIDLSFTRPVTILTGANASGKTTILNLLARHHDWPATSLATPRRRKKKGPFEFLTRLFRSDGEPASDEIGLIEYVDGQSTLRVPKASSPSYQVTIDGQQKVPCFFIPSHRAVYRYERIENIPRSGRGTSQAFQTVWNVGKTRYFGGGGHNASFHMKETLIAWSIFGRGNVDMDPEPDLLEHYEGFQAVLSRILPKSLGFDRLAIRDMEVIVECRAHEFLVDAASGGLSALFDLAWQVFMFATTQETGFTVLIDEVENHLHPTMQRRILPDLVEAFPSARFIVSTHSPLVVNSVRDSTVHILRHGSRGLVISEELDFQNRARSANQILGEVLGVDFSMPTWVERELRNIVDEAAASDDADRFLRLRERLSKLGLEEWMPQALGQVVGGEDD